MGANNGDRKRAEVLPFKGGDWPMSVVRFERRDISGGLLRFLEAENACRISALEFDVDRELYRFLADSQARLLRFDDRVLVVYTPTDQLIYLLTMQAVHDVRIKSFCGSQGDQTQ